VPGDGDGLAAAGVRAVLGFERAFISVHVAQRYVALGRGDADDGLLEIFFRETGWGSIAGSGTLRENSTDKPAPAQLPGW
jgi:hypothetical protein